MTTEINIDYYNELKRKADFVDKMISPSANAIYKELNELRSKVEELDYLAMIGKATEKAFKSGFSINQMHSVLSNVDYCMYDKESLLNWAESEGE